MMLVNELAEQYAQQMSSPSSALLQEVEAHTLAHHPHHHMLSGPTQGRLLSMLSRMARPRYILELGTFTGYSALCLAEGLQADGELHTIELREDDADTARRFFMKSNWASQLTLHIGNAHQIIPTLAHEWDFVFIDADKVNTIDYYEMIVPRMAPNGWMVVDNLLFHGQVLQTPIRGKNAVAMNQLASHVASDQRTQQVLLTVRDGLLLIQKLR